MVHFSGSASPRGQTLPFSIGLAVFGAGGEFHRVPFVAIPVEWNGFRKASSNLRRPGTNLQLLAVAHHVERVALSDDSHVGQAEHRFFGRRWVGLFRVWRRIRFRVAGSDTSRHDLTALRFVLAAEIGLDGVVVHVVGAHPALAARSLRDGGDFDHHFVAIFFDESCDDNGRQSK